ncbi:MAG TPA: TolC family protein [Bryobacteraceae bacterium]|nr:TolC family protein [Bryobacteraceae bacterium]
MACLFGAMLAVTGALTAQQAASPTTLTLPQAVENSLKNYPSIRVSQEQLNAATAQIQLARTAYLPRVDALAQVNRATRNNVFGLLLPQSVIPSMSGPVIGSNNLGSVWGSAIGGLVSWEPFDFGLRSANVALANAARAQSEAAVKRTQFEVAVAAVDAYLTLIAAQETVRAAQAGVDRAEVVVKTITAQVTAQLRPGADQSRAEAELAAARTQLIQAQQAIDISRATLSQFVGADPSQIAVVTGSLVQLPPEQAPTALNTAANPLMVEQSAAVEQARAQLRVLERSYFPKFYLQGAAYARGTGAETNGDRLGGLNGLAPNFQNYALGFSVTFPISDLPSLRAREAAQSATIRSQAARSEQIAVDLRAQWNRAVATLNGARRVAANTPVQVSAARTAVQQATARYESGLGIIADVAEAQRLLTQAEIDDVLARVSVWRGLLGVATAAGDLQPFLAEASQ